MSASTLQKTRFINDARQAMTQLYEAGAACRHMNEVGNDGGLLSGAGVLVDADFINENAGITAATFLAAQTAAPRAVNAVDRAAIAQAKL